MLFVIVYFTRCTDSFNIQHKNKCTHQKQQKRKKKYEHYPAVGRSLHVVSSKDLTSALPAALLTETLLRSRVRKVARHARTATRSFAPIPNGRYYVG